MQRAVTVGTISILLYLPGSTQANQPKKSGWQAGVAKVNITPKNLMWMSGYASRRKPADGKLTDLWAKALVLPPSRWDGG